MTVLLPLHFGTLKQHLSVLFYLTFPIAVEMAYTKVIFMQKVSGSLKKFEQNLKTLKHSWLLVELFQQAI